MLLVALTGCATAAPVRTTADGCDAVTVWDEFQSFAGKPGRDDAEMVAKRTAMLESWQSAVTSTSDWVASALRPAVDDMAAFVAGGNTQAEAVKLYGQVTAQLELLRAQCVEDGNL